MNLREVPAIVPAPLISDVEKPAVRRRRPPLPRWVRACLVAMVAMWVTVFCVAINLDPYDGGKVWLAETHRQLGLPPCTFKDATGYPCPSCGMTSSFALLIRGDLVHSVRANFVGTGLAVFGALFVPWGLVSAFRGRWWLVRKVEDILVRLTVLFLVVLFLRWGFVLFGCWMQR